jgi:4-hydroxy-3-polyprenylbenzoate decarboxylase
VKELHESFCEMRIIEGIKMILYVEHTVDPNDLPVALWRFCNNLDPKRDHFISKKQLPGSGKYVVCIGFDGTLKTKEFDDFYRDWPNIIIADDKTIASVDEKWERLGLGDFIPSPSLKFKGQMYGEEAVVDFNPQP